LNYGGPVIIIGNTIECAGDVHSDTSMEVRSSNMMQGKKKKLSDYVMEELKTRLDSGTLREGEKLPNQIEFARQLGVSRLSLREALNTLTQMGVIEQRPKVGTIIKSANPGLWTEKLTPPMLSDSRATMELLDARHTIETKVAALAAQKASTKELAAIAKDLERMRESILGDNVDEYWKNDVAFHAAIANASHNRYLIHMFITIRGLMERFMNEGFHLDSSFRVRSFDFHERIYKALQARDTTLTERLVGEHIDNVKDTFKQYYAQNGIKMAQQ